MYGVFDELGNFQGLTYPNYEDAYERATALNMRYQQGLENGYYHVEDIDDDELKELDNLQDIDYDIDYDAELPF